MKKSLLISGLFLMLTTQVALSQTQFWGVIQGSGGGAKTGIGSSGSLIFRTDGQGNNFVSEYTFSPQGGDSPQYTKLCEADNGKLYGMTSYGGDDGNGVLFEYDPNTERYVIKHSFKTIDGAEPSGSLFKAANGLLYGLTSYGGIQGSGTLFEYDPINSKFTKKFDFSSSFGEYPYGGVVEANIGKLYGMTSGGGQNGSGALFEFDIKTGIVSKKVDFGSIYKALPGGTSPYGDLTLASNGKLYGMTTFGGSIDNGVIFEYNPGADSVSVKYDFANSLFGGQPYGSLTQASNGKMYGMTSLGGTNDAGVIFEYNISTENVIVKFNLDSTINGYEPYGNLEEGTNGILYGLTAYGGANFGGTLFKFDTTSNSCTVLKNFGDKLIDGVVPFGTVTVTSQNRIFGLTSDGGSSGHGGILFEYDTITAKVVNKANLLDSDGNGPASGLIQAANGKFYGTTNSGGVYNDGVIYEYDPASGVYQKLFSFNLDSTGYESYSALFESSTGTLYGVAYAGGLYGYGTMYKFDINTNIFTKLHDFNDTAGGYPVGQLVEASNGKIYGVTSTGIMGPGIIFEYDTTSSQFTTPYSFGSAEGGMPNCGLLAASNNLLYGATTTGGASGYGTIFSFNPGTYGVDTLYSFKATDGYTVVENLVQSANDTIYGVSSNGGLGYGIIFKYDLTTGIYTQKAEFDYTNNGAYPNHGLTIGSDGNLYGNTSNGGGLGNGVIYEFNIAADTLLGKHNFDYTYGQIAGNLIETGCYTINTTATAAICKGESYIFGTQTLTTAGTYVETFVSLTGCDSIVTLTLTEACQPDNEYWGMTMAGGANGVGSIFKTDEKGENFKLVYSFNTGTTGNSPGGNLLQASNGKLYGLASAGGANNMGVIFEYNPVLKTYTKLFDFDGTASGSVPAEDLFELQGGKLYGMTTEGGINNAGVIFEFDIANNVFTKRIDFDSVATGAMPAGSLFLADNGHMYGVTRKGGVNDMGVLFEYNPANNSCIKRLDFDGAVSGADPSGSLMQANNGLLYGLASAGGMNNFGVVYSYNTSDSIYTKTYEFYMQSDGSKPQGNLVQANDGYLYGLTREGGMNNFGGLFQYDMYYNTTTLVVSFDSTTNGQYPNNSMVQSTTGKLLGMTTNGATNNNGTIFEYDPVTQNLINKHNFTGPDGANPYYGKLVLINQYPIYDTISAAICEGDTYMLGTQTLTTTGSYNEVFVAANGMDSTVTLNLLVNSSYSVYDTATICSGDSYILGTQTLTIAGNYSELFSTIAGCDSIVLLTLYVDSLPYKPSQPSGVINVDNTVGNSIYTTTAVANADSLRWLLVPASAGSISGNGISGTVSWSQTFFGTAKIFVKGINHCGEGSYSDSLMVSVTDNPVASFSYIINGRAVTFTNQSVNGGAYNWDFGNGAQSQEENPVYTYNRDGYYTVCLVARNILTNQKADSCVDITIGDPVNSCDAKFAFNVTDSMVTFTNNSTTGYTDVFWDFGDGKYSFDDNPTHKYSQPDVYDVTLIIYNASTNCTDEITEQIEVIFGSAVVCDANYSYFSNQDSISFINESSTNTTDFFWDFGDGQYSFLENPLHVFAESGYYEVTLSIYDSVSQCLDDRTKVIYVYKPGQASCNAKFTFYPDQFTVSFTSQAVGDYSQHFWDFNDGTNSNEVNPVHVYSKPGYYYVGYTVIDTVNGCFDTRYKDVFVEGSDSTSAASEITAKFSYVGQDNTNKITFSDKSLGNVTNWYWDFGDNSPASLVENPVYTYKTNDYYRVCLTANNSINQATKCKFIAVGDVSNSITAFFTYFADSLTSTGHFKNQALGNITTYYWDFGDGYSSEQKDPTHAYADTGYYAVCLTTTSASGKQKTYCDDVRIGNSIENPCLFSCVWPGDANNDLEANHYDIMTIGLNYNLTGPKRENATTNWYGQYGQNWSTYQLDGTNNKYGDCNGDGIIDINDVSAIKQNFAFSHYRQPDFKGADWVITCVWDTAATKMAGSRRSAKAQLGPPAKHKGGEIYAIGFEIEVIGGEKILWDSVNVKFDRSWFGEDGTSMLTVDKVDSIKHIIYVGMTRTDQQNVTGSGTIATINFRYKNNVLENGVSFNVTTKGGIQSTGEDVGVEGNIELDLNPLVKICKGSSAIIDAGSGFDTYTWSTGAKDTSRIEVNAAGTYAVTVSSASGATASDTVKVVVNDLPSVDLGEDITSETAFDLDAGAGQSAYLWSTGDTGQKIKVSKTGEYWVMVTNSLGCSAADTINVTVTSINDKISNKVSIYPNPNNGKFWLVYESKSVETQAVEIINLEGKTVWRKEFDISKSNKQLIQADNLKEGVYYLKVVHSDKTDLVRFVIY